MPQINIEKIKYFVNEGGAFVLSTGRTVGALSTVIDKLQGLLSPSITANGSVIYDFENDRAIYERFLPDDDRYIVKEVLKVCKNVGIEAHSGKDIFLLNRSVETDDHAEYENLSTKPLEYEDALKYNWNKVIYLFADSDESAGAKAVMNSCRHHSRFTDSSAVINGRKRCYCEHIPNGISKASAMAKLCEIFDIKENCCFAIGDYYNDLEMITAADIGAATIDSPDDIKSAADITVCSAGEGAVADFIDYLIKIMRGESNPNRLALRKETKNGRNY